MLTSSAGIMNSRQQNKMENFVEESLLECAFPPSTRRNTPSLKLGRKEGFFKGTFAFIAMSLFLGNKLCRLLCFPFKLLQGF